MAGSMAESWGDGLDTTKVTLTLIAGLLALLYWYSVSAFSQLRRMGIRHPWPAPFIGNVLLFQKGFWDGADQIIKTFGPITGYYLGRRPIVLLSDPEAVRQVLQKDFSNFTNRMMCPLINQGCDVLLSNLQGFADSGDPCNVQRCYACYTMDIVASVAFGTKVDSQKDPDHPLVQNSRKFLELFTPFKPLVLLTLAFPSIMIPIVRRLPNKNRDQVNRFFGTAIRGMVAARDGLPANERRRDFLQLMLDARSSAARVSVDHFDIVNQADVTAPVGEEPVRRAAKTLSEDEILGQAFIFLIAGYETTCSLLSFTTYLLATHPACQEELLREVDHFAENHDGADYNTVHDLPYMDLVISESLRMYPPAFRFAREAARDCTVMGCKIPAGTVLEIPIGCMQNDPKYWAEPEEFRPERFSAEEKQKRHPFLYLPFGAGPRSCIGMRLAILEAKITLYRILRRFRFQTCPRTQIPLQVTAVSTLRPKDGVYVKILAR
ncbi:thromboxane-A synthase isoform X2 [Dendropsophus ebraccatus]|uniref:thromboxane-A synthase isoform X2 n=1 Tax=Dendropsophus ebraccatus TaxID=150705 RepID=UPI003831E9A9